MLNMILDEWMPPWHRENYDFSTIDINRYIFTLYIQTEYHNVQNSKGVGGLDMQLLGLIIIKCIKTAALFCKRLDKPKCLGALQCSCNMNNL